MIVRNNFKTGLFAGIVLLLGTVSARADFVFSFDDGTLTNSSTNTAITAYMNSKFGCVNCITLNPSGGTVRVDKTYTADGNVVGPGNGTTSLTLGNSNGATSNAATPGGSDLFLANTNDSGTTNTDRIVIKFATAMTGTFSFDYEIFPNITCQSLSNCGSGGSNLPDFKFETNGSTLVWDKTGDAPCATVGGCQSSATSGANGNSAHSPDSGSGTTETAPQLIGHWSGFLSNVTELDFIDWPATIGVDNIAYTSAPEPRGTAFLLGALVLVGFAGNKLRRAFGKA